MTFLIIFIVFILVVVGFYAGCFITIAGFILLIFLGWLMEPKQDTENKFQDSNKAKTEKVEQTQENEISEEPVSNNKNPEAGRSKLGLFYEKWYRKYGYFPQMKTRIREDCSVEYKFVDKDGNEIEELTKLFNEEKGH